ncbi:hypothetical protein NDU88_004354 [Pleurodeles waltl]|uniref:Uncharacterized protein n=1 Tax=Pleurodeles waltl TaxID=8319 RepID=A0AAV7TR85_PLEWA|nr:hypothetical protein NDU88_004354 [Pleurodeles waltl]
MPVFLPHWKTSTGSLTLETRRLGVLSLIGTYTAIKGRTGVEQGPGDEAARMEEVEEEEQCVTEAAQRGIQSAERGPAGESAKCQAAEEFPVSAETHQLKNSSSDANTETARRGAH